MIIITASYGTIVRGSVFEIKFRVVGRVFESIETKFSHNKISCPFTKFKKKCSLRKFKTELGDFTKIFVASMFEKSRQKVNKNLKSDRVK